MGRCGYAVTAGATGQVGTGRERGSAVPAVPAALAHPVCRGVFDHRDEFLARHEARSGDLSATVLAGAEASATFDGLLGALCYGAADVVRAAVESSADDAVRPRLAAYDDYGPARSGRPGRRFGGAKRGEESALAGWSVYRAPGPG